MRVDINWGLAGGGNNALAHFQTGYNLVGGAMDRKENREYRQQQLARQKAQDEAAAADRQQSQRRADLPMVARLLEHADKGPEQWAQAFSVAKQYNIPIDGAPTEYTPGWGKQQAETLKILQTPEGQQALSNAGKIATDMGAKPGTPEHARLTREIWTAGESKPYVVGGETRLYQPKLGGTGQAVGSPPPEAIDELKRDPSAAAEFDEAFGQGAAARVLGQGGGGGNVTSGFLDGLELQPGG